MISIIVMIVAGTAMAVLVIALFYAISVNIRRGEAVRKALSERLAQLRLYRVLGLLGIDPKAFIHTQQLRDVERQMRTCANCKATEQCDSTLEKGTSGELGFCENREELSALRPQAR